MLLAVQSKLWPSKIVKLFSNVPGFSREFRGLVAAKLNYSCIVACCIIIVYTNCTFNCLLVIAERLSVRHIIVQARLVLVGSLSEVVFVCLSVTGLRLKYTGLRIVYVSVSSSTCPLFFTLALMMEDSSEDRRRRQARERMQRYRRRLSAQQRDERRPYKSERRRLVRQHQHDSLRSMTRRERDRRRTARHRSLHGTSP